MRSAPAPLLAFMKGRRDFRRNPQKTARRSVGLVYGGLRLVAADGARLRIPFSIMVGA